MIKFFKLLIVITLAASCAMSNRNKKKMCQHTKTSFRCVEYIKNYDGDTITFNIPGLHPLIGDEIPVRVRAIDTPEIRGRSDCEKNIAKEARFFVASKLKLAKNIELRNAERGKYFRIVADVVVDGTSIRDQLIKFNLGRSYNGKTKTNKRWCEENK